MVVAPRKPVQDAFIERPSGWFVPRPALPLNRGRLIRAAAAECDAGGSRSGFARLVLRGRFRGTVVGAGRRPFLLSLQLLVVSGRFGAIAGRTLKADNSVCASSDSRLLAAPQDAPFPGNFLLRPHAPIFDTRPAAAFPIRSISNLRARAVLRVALRYRRTASALSRTRRSDGFS